MTETHTEQTRQENETKTNIWDASVIGLETNTHTPAIWPVQSGFAVCWRFLWVWSAGGPNCLYVLKQRKCCQSILG